MLQEWEHLDGDDSDDNDVLQTQRKDLKEIDTERCLPNILRMTHSKEDEKVQDAVSLLMDSGDPKRYRAWSSCFNQCERSVAPVWNLVTKDYHKDFETCHCACYKVSSISDSNRRREILLDSTSMRVKKITERVLSLAANAYAEEMKSRQYFTSTPESTWSSTDNDPCNVGYALVPRRTFWAGGCSWGKNRCGRRVHPGWVAAGLSRGLEPLSHGLRLYADFIRDYLTPTNSLSSLKLLTRTPNADTSLVLRLGGSTFDVEEDKTKLLDIKSTAAGIPVPRVRTVEEQNFWKQYRLRVDERSTKWVYQFWHRKLMLFHSKRKFGKFLSNVKGIPVTFFLPEELDTALEVMRKCTECNWIYKPSHGSGGFGVRAVGISDVEEIREKRDQGKKTTLAVLQRAVTSLLVDKPGRKFDLRVYVAVASWKPLIAFILPDSLVRLAYRPFTKGTKDKCATRTNTAQRKYCAVEDEDFDKVTHNRTLSCVCVCARLCLFIERNLLSLSLSHCTTHIILPHTT